MISSLLYSWFSSYSFWDLWIKSLFKLCNCSRSAFNSSFSASLWAILVYLSKVRVVCEDLKLVCCSIFELIGYFFIILGGVIISFSRLLLKYFFKETLLFMLGEMVGFLGGPINRFFRHEKQFESIWLYYFLFYCRYKSNKIKKYWGSLHRFILRKWIC